MIKKFPLFLILSTLPTLLHAEAKYAIRGYLSAKAGRYTTSGSHENSHQQHRAQIEQESTLLPELIFVNQLRWSYSSLYNDVSVAPSSDKKDTQKIFLGDNFMKVKAPTWVLQTGYQEIGWGEAFGFNYADIVNPKDMKETFYSDYSESRLPLFLVNYKYFFTDGSLQLIYSPEPRFSETLPINLFTKTILPQTNITAMKEATPDFFKKHEYGGKLSASFWGLDTSLFYFSYLDRDANYILESATPTSIVLKENHSPIQTGGLSLASTLGDGFVFRTDLVYTKDKKINSIKGTSLLSTPVNVSNVLVSLDTPTYNKFSAVFILAGSQLSVDLDQAIREKTQTYSIAKVSYDFGEQKIFDLSYTHEFSNNGHAVQSLLTWPISSTIDLRFGAEVYWGDEKSELDKIKNISSVFFGIKNYFQL